MSNHISRRRLLRYAAVTSALLAGCAGGDGDATDGTTTTTETTTTTTTTTEETTTETTEETTTETPSNRLSVSDQTVMDMSVTVPDAAIDDDGWLIVHPQAEGGGPNGGVVLGKEPLEAGEYEDVGVDLDVVTTGGRTVYGMLHYDQPADDSFTFPEDGDPPVTKDGSPIVKPFEVAFGGTITSQLSVTNQETEGGSVTVPLAAIDEPGWLIIHPEADGGGPNGGVVLGKQQLEPGLYRDRTLSIDPEIGADQRLYAMLHYDDPADGSFTFPQDGDPAVTTDDSPVLQPFDVTVPAETATVDAISTTFDPKRLSVSPGTTVEWVNKDSYGHDVTSATFHDSATSWEMAASLPGGGTVSHTFEESGIYEYYCTIHGQGSMCGVVLVGDVTLDEDLPC